MTISQNSEYVLEHPFTKKAISEACTGDLRGLKFIFDLLQIDMYQEVAGMCSRSYRANKRENYPDIVRAIREIEPPTRLSAQLPTPVLGCVVVLMGSGVGVGEKEGIQL